MNPIKPAHRSRGPALLNTSAGWDNEDFSTASDLTISSVSANGRVWTGTIGEVWVGGGLSLAQITHYYNKTKWRYL